MSYFSDVVERAFRVASRRKSTERARVTQNIEYCLTSKETRLEEDELCQDLRLSEAERRETSLTVTLTSIVISKMNNLLLLEIAKMTRSLVALRSVPLPKS